MNLIPIQLDALAKRINEREDTIQLLKKSAVDKVNQTITEAILQGQDLIDAKSKVKHGGWLDWLAKNCHKISSETASRYMRLSNSSHVTDLTTATGLRQAYITCGILPPDEAKSSLPSACIRLPRFTPILERKPIPNWTGDERKAFKEWHEREVLPIVEELSKVE